MKSLNPIVVKSIATVDFVNTKVNELETDVNELSGDVETLETTVNTIAPKVNQLEANYPKTIYGSVNILNPVGSENFEHGEFRVISTYSSDLTLNNDYIKITNYSDDYNVIETKKPIDLHLRLSQNLTKLLPSASNLYLYLTDNITTGLTSLTSNSENLILVIQTEKEISDAFWEAMNKSGFLTIKIVNIAGNKLNSLTFENNTTVTKIVSSEPLRLKTNLFYGCSSLISVNFKYQNTIPTNCFYNNLVNQSAQDFYDWLVSHQIIRQYVPDVQQRYLPQDLDKLIHQIHISVRYRNYYNAGEQYIFRPNVNQASSQSLDTQNGYMLGATSSKHILKAFSVYSSQNTILTSSFRFELSDTPFYIPFWENNGDNHELGIRIQNGLGEDLINISSHTTDPKNLLYESDISSLSNKSWKGILTAYGTDAFNPYLNDNFEIIFKNVIPPQYYH